MRSQSLMRRLLPLAITIALALSAERPLVAALTFTNASNTYVDFGSHGSLDPGTTGTYAAVFRAVGGGGGLGHYILAQRSSGAGHYIRAAGASLAEGFNGRIDRNTNDLRVETSTGLTDSVWHFGAFTWNTAGVDGDQHLYAGSIASGTLVELSYDLRDVGSGAITGHGSVSMLGGIRDTGSSGSRFNGDIAWVGIWTRQLSLAELKAVRFGQLPRNGLVLNAHLWHGASGTQLDRSSFLNHGSSNGSLVNVAHPAVLIPFMRR